MEWLTRQQALELDGTKGALEALARIHKGEGRRKRWLIGWISRTKKRNGEGQRLDTSSVTSTDETT